MSKKKELSHEFRNGIIEYQKNVPLPILAKNHIYVVKFSKKDGDTVFNLIRCPGLSKFDSVSGVYKDDELKPLAIIDYQNLGGDLYTRKRSDVKSFIPVRMKEDFPPLYRYKIKNRKIILIGIDTISDRWEKWWSNFLNLVKNRFLEFYNYKYNGKELQDDLVGLNLYDFGARNYEPAIGRWMNVDPLAEKYFPISSYVYALNNPMYFIDPDGNFIIIYYGINNKKKKEYEYEKDRDYSSIKDEFLANAYKAMDALYETSNIEIDGKKVNIIETIMNDKRELSLVEGGEQGGSHFAEGRSYNDIEKTDPRSKNNIGTIYFNTKEGNLYDDVNDTKGTDLIYLLSKKKLSKTTKIVSATSILGHEFGHAYDFATSPSEYFKRRLDRSPQNATPYFSNAEEVRAMTLSNLININLGQPQRNNYRAIGIPTQGVLSNKRK